MLRTIALLLALALYARVPGMRFFRIAWFTPVLMSYVVVGIIWVWIYNYDWGVAPFPCEIPDADTARPTATAGATTRSRRTRAPRANVFWCDG